MNIKSLLIAASAALCLVSCGSKPGDVTRISGEVSDSSVTEVNVRISQVIDTTIKVTDGKFSVDTPAFTDKIGNVLFLSDGQIIKYGYFIPDGTQITVYEDGEELKVKSSADYICGAFAAYRESLAAIYEAEGENMAAELESLWFETIKANPANALAVLVISDSMYDLAPEKMLEMISHVQEPIRSERFVTSREGEAKAQLATREGMKFTDFTVEHVYGYDRSMDPQPLKKEVRFSDYVGKGTYVLVDFWSPWCGPCRREIPNIQKVYEQYKDKGLEVLSIAVWERKPQSHTIETAAELGMDWHHINNAQSVPTDIYGIGGIPHLMLIGPDGTILKRGFHGLEGIEAAVSEYIK